MPSIRTRRSFLITLGAGVAGLALSACGGATATTATTSAGTTAPTTSTGPTAPAAPTPVPATAAVATTTATTTAAATTAVESSASTATVATAMTQTVSATAGAPQAAKRALQFFVYLDDTQAKDIQSKLFSSWTAEHPALPVEAVLQPGATVKAIEKLTTLVAGGLPPDVSEDIGIANNLGGGHLIQPIDDLIGRDKYDLGQFGPKGLAWLSLYQGKHYIIPERYDGNGTALLYDRQLFSAAGVAEPPATWADAWGWSAWATNLQHLTKTGADGKVSQFGLGSYGYFMYYPEAYGGQWLANDWKTVVCDSPETIQAYTDWFDLALKLHVTPQPGEAAKLFGKDDLFLKQHAAISTMGGWEVDTYTGAPAKGVDWAFMPFPKAKVATPQMAPVGLALVEGTKQREDAWLLLQWLVDVAHFPTFMQHIPAVQAAVLPWAKRTFPAERRPEVLAEGVAQAEGVQQDNIVWIPQWPTVLSTVITPAFNQLWAGTKPVASTLRELKPTLQNLVNQPQG